jgi:diguanylate cyclase
MYKVLAIDDDPGIRDLVESFLEEDGYQVFTADGGINGVAQAQVLNPDLIICDVEMPDMEGWSVLQQIRKNETLQHTPFLFLTGLDEMRYLRRGMELGADDYLTKPFSYAQLSKAVKVRLEKHKAFLEHFEAELEAADQKLDRSLNYDNVTNLPNRNRVSESFLANSQNHAAWATLVFSLDKFTDFSQNQPEALVNIVLKGVADRLKVFFPEPDQLFYLQNNQFLAFLPSDANFSGLLHKSQQALAQLSEPFRIMGREIYVTASVGLAVYPQHASDWKELLRQANTARLAAEAKGGNQAQFTD